MRSLLLLCFCVLSFAFADKLQAADAPRITGVYSDMEFNFESGDVVGVEVVLVFSRKGYFVIFQNAEGSPSVPVVVPARVEAGQIQFDVPFGENVSVFNGSISREVIVGEFSGGVLSKEGRSLFVIPKKLSYWQ